MSASPDRRSDPLTEILLRPTTSASATPAIRARARALADRSVPPRSAASSAMARNRAAILAGAGRAVEISGTKVSMAQFATAAGVAKGTLYNHFRTREEVLVGLLLGEIDRLISEIAHLPLADALIRAASAVSDHPLLEALGGDDFSTLAVLARVDVRTAGWGRVATAVDAILSRADLGGTSTVLRWLSSFITAPADLADIEADVAILVAGLPPRSATRTAVQR
jgi:AcrR family transcriptional regulator